MRFIALFLALLLTACSAGVQADLTKFNTQVDTTAKKIEGDVSHFLDSMNKFTIADLTAAKADADAHGDLEASMCWAGLIPIVQSIGTGGAQPVVPKIIGGATLFQAVRNLIQGSHNADATPILRQVNIACGALYVSARGDIIKVAGMIASTGVGGPGAAGVAGAIPVSLEAAVGALVRRFGGAP